MTGLVARMLRRHLSLNSLLALQATSRKASIMASFQSGTDCISSGYISHAADQFLLSRFPQVEGHLHTQPKLCFYPQRCF